MFQFFSKKYEIMGYFIVSLILFFSICFIGCSDDEKPKVSQTANGKDKVPEFSKKTDSLILYDEKNGYIFTELSELEKLSCLLNDSIYQKRILASNYNLSKICVGDTDIVLVSLSKTNDNYNTLENPHLNINKMILEVNLPVASNLFMENPKPIEKPSLSLYNQYGKFLPVSPPLKMLNRGGISPAYLTFAGVLIISKMAIDQIMIPIHDKLDNINFNINELKTFLNMERQAKLKASFDYLSVISAAWKQRGGGQIDYHTLNTQLENIDLLLSEVIYSIDTKNAADRFMVLELSGSGLKENYEKADEVFNSYELNTLCLTNAILLRTLCNQIKLRLPFDQTISKERSDRLDKLLKENKDSHQIIAKSMKEKIKELKGLISYESTDLEYQDKLNSRLKQLDNKLNLRIKEIETVSKSNSKLDNLFKTNYKFAVYTNSNGKILSVVSMM